MFEIKSAKTMRADADIYNEGEASFSLCETIVSEINDTASKGGYGSNHRVDSRIASTNTFKTFVEMLKEKGFTIEVIKIGELCSHVDVYIRW